MATAVQSLPVSNPLTSEDQQVLADAHRRAASIRSAARVAAFNGWTIGAFAALSLPMAGSSLSGLLIAAALGFAAYNEFRGRTRLLQFDRSAPRLLGWNQVGLLAAIVTYCVWQILAASVGPNPMSEQLTATPELVTLLGSTEELVALYRWVVVAVYGSTILLSAVFQGGNAWYYFSRGKMLDAHLAATPSWVVDVQRTMN